MARRNIADRADIPADALRQRRDLYSLSIGLLIFNLAGGVIEKKAQAGALLPITLANAEMLLWATWVGFGYFWLRFWLISEGKPIDDFLEDVRWQAGDSRTIRRIAAELTTDLHQKPAAESRQALLAPGGPVPRIEFQGLQPKISLAHLSHRASGRRQGTAWQQTLGHDSIDVPRAARVSFWSAYIRGFFTALYRERSFTDYTLPHLFAATSLIIGLARPLWD